jgi:putative Mg2+ transporter-C (MgtC) family protein
MEALYPWLGDLHAVPGLRREAIGLICIMVSLVCGAFVGIEREKRDKPAGIRTVILISVGSTIFTIISELIAQGRATADPARLAAQILPGIGFLGAGAILHARGTVVGLTTGATIWTVAAVGVTIGAGYVAAGVAFTVVIFFTLDIMQRLEWLFTGRCQVRKATVTYRSDSGRAMPRIQEVIDRHRIPDSALVHRKLENGTMEIEIPVCMRHRHHRIILKELADTPQVSSIEMPGMP